MSVEGMWKFQIGSVAEPDVLCRGGIAVLESTRVFGGDSVMAYLGTYEVDRRVFKARFRSWKWNFDVGEVQNVFGMTGQIDYIALIEGAIDDDVITGHIVPENAPDIRVNCRFERISLLD